MFVSKKTYEALQKQVEEAKLSMSISETEIDRLKREISDVACRLDACEKEKADSYIENRKWKELLLDCLQWMSEINLPKKTAGTADKERRREKLCQEAKALGIGEQEET